MTAERTPTAVADSVGDGERLVFLVSQPRSGSTLLQRLLSAHPRVVTDVESWIMLLPAYALDSPTNGVVSAPYHHPTLRLALEDFLATQAYGRDSWLRALRAYAGELYGAALAKDSEALLLDKTPAYTRILPVLHEIFPSARFIFLLRDPRAILASVLDTWMGNDPSLLHRARWGLVDAPRAIAAALAAPSGRKMTVHYESLVGDPEHELNRIFEFLELEPQRIAADSVPRPPDDPLAGDAERIERQRYRPFLGDPRGVYRLRRVDASRAGGASELLASEPGRILAAGYLDYLGPEVLQALGYSHLLPRSGPDDLRPPVGRELRFSTAVTPPDARDSRQRLEFACWTGRGTRSLRPLWKWVRYELAIFRRRARRLEW